MTKPFTIITRDNSLKFVRPISGNVYRLPSARARDDGFAPARRPDFFAERLQLDSSFRQREAVRDYPGDVVPTRAWQSLGTGKSPFAALSRAIAIAALCLCGFCVLYFAFEFGRGVM